MPLSRAMALVVAHTILMWVIALGLLGRGLGLLGDNPFAPTVGFAILFAFIVVVSVGGWLMRGSVPFYGSWRSLGWDFTGFSRQVLIGIPLGVVGIAITMLSIHTFLQVGWAEIVDGMLDVGWPQRAVFVLIGLHAGLVEESLFRGNLFGALRAKCPVLLAVAIQAAVFSLYHLSFGPASLINKFLCGIVFASPQLLLGKRLLLPGAIAHFMVAVTMTSL
jgi:membrane protease YdiL (CAAX protease family)